jgi:hypothetical protein
MKKITTLFVLLFSALAFAQSVNDYKYVLVPSKFDFTRQRDLYGLNSLTKALMEKYGFETYLDTDAMPDDVRNFNCNKLYVEVLENNNITNTKLTIVLKDCKNNILFTSAEGKSKEKDLRVAYNMALRDAAKSFDDLGYKYNGSTMVVERETIKTTNDGTVVKKEVVPVSSTVTTGNNVLLAQPIANGFQLIDNAPKIVMKIFSTNSATIFIAEKDAFKGVLHQENGNWILEYYANNKLVSEAISIKF